MIELKRKRTERFCRSNLMLFLSLELILCSIFVPPDVSWHFSGTMLAGYYTYSLNDLGIFFVRGVWIIECSLCRVILQKLYTYKTLLPLLQVDYSRSRGVMQAEQCEEHDSLSL